MNMKKSLFLLSLIFIFTVFCTNSASAGKPDFTLTDPAEGSSYAQLPITFAWNGPSNNKQYQLRIWGPDNTSIFTTLCEQNNFLLKDKNLENGTYTWAVRTIGFLGIFPSSDFTEKRTFLIQGNSSDKTTEFKVTGKTLIIPCEFLDVKFSNTKTNTDFMFPAPDESANKTLETSEAVNDLINKKLGEMRRFLKICSRNATEANMESAFDIAPIFTAINNREYYGKDYKFSKDGKNYFNNDAGTESEEKYYGNRLLKKHALTWLVKNYDIPVHEYNHLIYLVPGNKENPPSNQVYPCSYSGKPWDIKKIPGTDELTGSTHCGIMQPLGAQVGTFAHEFGHQLGLPDLYPYSNIPNRDLGYSGLMASGSHYNTSFTCMSKMKSYDKSYFKKGWIDSERMLIVKETGTYTVHSRNSTSSPNMIYILLNNTFEPRDCFAIEVFDREDIDKNIAAYLSADQGNGKANAGVFIYYMDDIDVDDIKFLNTVPVTEKGWQRVFLPGGNYSDYGVNISVESLVKDNDHYKAEIKVSFDEKAEQGKIADISDSIFDKGDGSSGADNNSSKSDESVSSSSGADVSSLNLTGRLKKSLNQMVKGVALIIKKGRAKISTITKNNK